MQLFTCTGGEIRTPINGFGDRYSTLELRPCLFCGGKYNNSFLNSY